VKGPTDAERIAELTSQLAAQSAEADKYSRALSDSRRAFEALNAEHENLKASSRGQVEDLTRQLEAARIAAGGKFQPWKSRPPIDRAKPVGPKIAAAPLSNRPKLPAAARHGSPARAFAAERAKAAAAKAAPAPAAKAPPKPAPAATAASSPSKS
jgi:hypothetical protein